VRVEEGSDWVGEERQGGGWEESFFKLETVIVGSVEVGREGWPLGVGEESRVETFTERVRVLEMQEG
jgi:hypothetical protein